MIIVPAKQSESGLTIQEIAQRHPQAVGGRERFDLVVKGEDPEGQRVLGAQLHPNREEKAAPGSVVAVGRESQTGQAVTLPGSTPLHSYEPA